MTYREACQRSHRWMLAVFTALLTVWSLSSGATFCYAADEAAPVAESETDGDASERAESDGQQRETRETETAPAEEVAEEVVEEVDSEEADGEVEVEPDEEEGNEPPTKDGEEEAKPPKKAKRIIGATATVLEKQSNLLFRARVDTGAKSCSLHVEELTIDDEQEKYVDNIGKVVRFKVRNRADETHWLEGRIEGYVIVRTAGARQRRYKVPLTLRWKGVEKTILVTINDRNGMEYPLLLGRNFLRGDFVVDVEVDDDD